LSVRKAVLLSAATAALVVPGAVAGALVTLHNGDEAFVAKTHLECRVHMATNRRVIDCVKGGASYVFPGSYRVMEGNHIVKVFQYDTSTTP
jgi:hypothetical protein